MASTTQVEFEAVEIIPEVAARIQSSGEQKPEPTPSAPDASKVNALPLATVAAAISAFMTLAAASFLVMKQRRRRTLEPDAGRAMKEGNALDATVTDETASRVSSRSKLQTSEFGAEDMETSTWYN